MSPSTLLESMRVEPAGLAGGLGRVSGLEVYPGSICAAGRAGFFLGRDGEEKRLGVVFEGEQPGFSGDRRDVEIEGRAYGLLICPTGHGNACALREELEWTAPRVLGLVASAGLGDRLGLATPGHVRAVRRYKLAPVFAQQSIRELERTGRTPEQVIDDATWGVFQEGFREGFGADADHLKTFEDVDRCAAAGFTLYTVDPSEHVDDAADGVPPDVLQAKFDLLDWPALDASPGRYEEIYLGCDFAFEGFRLRFERADLARAAVKYGRAVAHTAAMFRHLEARMDGRPFELEMSVDETATPTSELEHLFVASELRRLGVRWVSLAPRFVGGFEKGVDYIGDLEEFERSFARHAALARELGPYKLSLHSGSDKFSIYPVVARHTRGLLHLKTAGTSYLEALRVLARIDAGLFREVFQFSLDRFPADRASYHVSAELARVPGVDELDGLLDHFDARQVLHVTFGSVLAEYGPRLVRILSTHEEEYCAALDAHIGRAARRVPMYLETFQVRRGQFFGAQGHSGHGTFPNVIRLVSSGRLDLSPILTASFGLDQAVSAIARSTERRDGKIVVHPGKGS